MLVVKINSVIKFEFVSRREKIAIDKRRDKSSTCEFKKFFTCAKVDRFLIFSIKIATINARHFLTLIVSRFVRV